MSGYLHKTITEVNKTGESYFKVVESDDGFKSIGVLKNGIQKIYDSMNDIKISPTSIKRVKK